MINNNLSFEILCEMNKKAQQLVKLMKQGIVEFMFKKASTGKMRKAHGTLNRSLIPPEDQRKPGRPKYRPDYLVIYYDTDKKAIRSFKDFLLQDFKKNAIISKTPENGNSKSSDDKSKKQVDDKKKTSNEKSSDEK